MRRNNKKKETPKPKRAKSVRTVMGVHSCNEVIAVRPQSIVEIWIKEEWEKSSSISEIGRLIEGWVERPVKAQSGKGKIIFKTVSLKKLDSLGHGHQGIAFFVDGRPEFSWDQLDSEGPATVVLLDGIVDPQNLGAMMRTGWLMGVKAFFLPKDRSTGLTPVVNKIASGGAEHVPLELSNNFVAVIKKLKEKGFWVYSLAESESDNIYSLDFSKDPKAKIAWVIGGEGKGVRTAVKKESDVRVRIPQMDSKASYNASVALGMALALSANQNLQGL